MHNIYTYALILIFFISCDKSENTLSFTPLNDDIPISISAMITNDSIYVCVNNSVISNYNQTDTISGIISCDTSAQISIYKNNQLYSTLTIKNIYESNYKNNRKYYYAAYGKNETGKYYTLKVKHPKYGTITANTYLPKQITNVTVDTQNILEKTYSDGLMWFINVKMNFEQLDTETEYVAINYTGIKEFMFLYFNDNMKKQMLPFAPDYLFFNENNLFKDSCFNFIFPKQNYSDSLYFLLKAVNIDYVTYWKSHRVVDITSKKPFSKPLSLYSNINNSMGVFYGVTTYKFKIP